MYWKILIYTVPHLAHQAGHSIQLSFCSFQTSMWICGTANKKLRPPTPSDKAHGKGRGRGEEYWSQLICTAIGDGLLQLSFSSIRATGLFRPQIAATLALTSEGMKVACGEKEWKIPNPVSGSTKLTQRSKKARTPGGSNLMPIIENLLSSHTNCYQITTTAEYQYPGVLTSGDGCAETQLPLLTPLLLSLY